MCGGSSPPGGTTLDESPDDTFLRARPTMADLAETRPRNLRPRGSGPRIRPAPGSRGGSKPTREQTCAIGLVPLARCSHIRSACLRPATLAFSTGDYSPDRRSGASRDTIHEPAGTGFLQIDLSNHLAVDAVDTNQSVAERHDASHNVAREFDADGGRYRDKHRKRISRSGFALNPRWNSDSDSRSCSRTSQIDTDRRGRRSCRSSPIVARCRTTTKDCSSKEHCPTDESDVDQRSTHPHATNYLSNIFTRHTRLPARIPSTQRLHWIITHLGSRTRHQKLDPHAGGGPLNWT